MSSVMTRRKSTVFGKDVFNFSLFSGTLNGGSAHSNFSEFDARYMMRDI